MITTAKEGMQRMKVQTDTEGKRSFFSHAKAQALEF